MKTNCEICGIMKSNKVLKKIPTKIRKEWNELLALKITKELKKMKKNIYMKKLIVSIKIYLKNESGELSQKTWIIIDAPIPWHIWIYFFIWKLVKNYKYRSGYDAEIKSLIFDAKLWASSVSPSSPKEPPPNIGLVWLVFVSISNHKLIRQLG